MSKRRSERRSAPRPGSATHGYRNPDPKQQRRRRRRHCSRVRWPRFPQLALRPHPSRPGSESVSSHPAPCQKDVRRGVRRRDRGQRPTATEIRIRNNNAGGAAATVAGYAGPGFHTWPSSHIPQDPDLKPFLCIRPHTKKDVRRGVGRRDRGQRPTATKDPNTKPLRRRHYPRATDTKRLRR
jgi:hypothetical protein